MRNYFCARDVPEMWQLRRERKRRERRGLKGVFMAAAVEEEEVIVVVLVEKKEAKDFASSLEAELFAFI